VGTNNTFNPVLYTIVDAKLSGRWMDKTSPAVTDIKVHIKLLQQTEFSKGRRCMAYVLYQTSAIQVR
jgi:hypothetical protein